MPVLIVSLRFYLSEVLIALKWLHDNGIIYRNLKLDNILLDIDGHIKLVGFYFSKTDIWPGVRTRTFCGTQEFMAPEVVFYNSYSGSVALKPP